jgi:RNA polymerase subunit RPABC4/transcription elongation factor Spt4
VGAVNWWNDVLAEYSSQGPTTDGRLKPEISAPTGISGATYGEEEFHGTSASAPHVAGAAALVWQAHPEFTRQEVVDFLLEHSVDLGPRGPDTAYGYGRLQLPAPSTAGSPSAPTDTPLPTSTTGPAAATDTPLPTDTPVAYVTPTLPSTSTGEIDLGALTGLGVLIGGLGCAGVGLLLIGGVGMLVLTRRERRRPSPPAPVSPAPTVPSRPSQPRTPRCAVCGTSVRPEARFCPVCGQPLAPKRQARYCRYCGAKLRDRARFCPLCGRAVR